MQLIKAITDANLDLYVVLKLFYQNKIKKRSLN